MTRMFLVLVTLVVTAFLISCGAPTGNNAPANNANTNRAAANSTTPAVDVAAAEAEIRKLMDTAQAALAKNDADAMEKIYADNYVLVNIDGSVQNKAERVAALRSGDAKYSSFAYSDATIRVNPEGNGAIAVAKLTMKGVFRGKPTDGDFRVTQVYSKTKDGWKQVGAQATKIEGGSAPAKADDKMKTANTKADAADAPPAANK